MLYNDGINRRVIIVPNKSPTMIDTAIPSHISPPLKYSGNSPNTVVNVASIIGLNRCKHAVITESCTSRLSSFCSISMRSISTMALFITIPANEIKPKKGMNPKGS